MARTFPDRDWVMRPAKAERPKGIPYILDKDAKYLVADMTDDIPAAARAAEREARAKEER